MKILTGDGDVMNENMNPEAQETDRAATAALTCYFLAIQRESVRLIIFLDGDHYAGVVRS